MQMCVNVRACMCWRPQGNVAVLTRERDDLSKKLYFAEFARDQTKAAKELAADQMIKARCVAVARLMPAVMGWWGMTFGHIAILCYLLAIVLIHTLHLSKTPRPCATCGSHPALASIRPLAPPSSPNAACSQALKEERVRKQHTPVRTASLPMGGRGAAAAAAAAAAGGGDGSALKPWQRSSSQPAKKW